jgi:hypothetical protein
MFSLPIVTTGSSGHKVFCLWPHSSQAYSTRPWSALTRLGAPHLPHFTSSWVLPRVMVTFRAIASLTKRPDSWRIASFDIAGARGFRTINSPSLSLLTRDSQIAQPSSARMSRPAAVIRTLATSTILPLTRIFSTVRVTRPRLTSPLIMAPPKPCAIKNGRVAPL